MGGDNHEKRGGPLEKLGGGDGVGRAGDERGTSSSPPAVVAADDSTTRFPRSMKTWKVPGTSHTGGSWLVIDGFATREECAAVITASTSLHQLQEPLRKYSEPPLGASIAPRTRPR